MEHKPNLAKAIIAVMKAVKGIDKSMTVGSGSMSYKGVPDQEVKKVIGAAMEQNGLCILPIETDAKTQVDRWTETGGQYGDKQKQSVFTEVTTKYLLLHESGESQIVSGYGHGVDSQDKGAGKATTYALKYALLYCFMVPTGKIDDSDNIHSDEQAAPPTRQPQAQQPAHNGNAADDKPWLNKADKQGNLTDTWKAAVNKLQAGATTVDKIASVYKISKDNKTELLTYQKN